MLSASHFMTTCACESSQSIFMYYIVIYIYIYSSQNGSPKKAAHFTPCSHWFPGSRMTRLKTVLCPWETAYQKYETTQNARLSFEFPTNRKTGLPSLKTHTNMGAFKHRTVALWASLKPHTGYPQKHTYIYIYYTYIHKTHIYIYT